MTSTLTYNPPDILDGNEETLKSIGIQALEPYNSPTDDNPDAMTNHWVLEFWGHNGIAMDFRPTGRADRSGALTICHRTGYVEKEAKNHFLAVEDGWKVKDVIDMIIEARYDRYRFAEGSRGSRFWVTEVLRFLAKKRVVKRNQEDGGMRRATWMLKKVWVGEDLVEEEEQSGIVGGGFY